MDGKLDLWHDFILDAGFETETTFHTYGGDSSLSNTRINFLKSLFYDVLWLINYIDCYGDTPEDVMGCSKEQATKAGWMRDDCVRVFADLAHLDIQKAAWCYLARPHACDEVFARFVYFLTTAYEACTLGDSPSEDFFVPDSLDVVGDVLWQVTSHIPQSLTSPPPPPPYTLHAFNIELPAIEWPRAQAEDVRLWSTKSGVGSKRASPPKVRHTIIQNLLHLTAECKDTAGDVQGSRITEIFEDLEEEDLEEEDLEEEDLEEEDSEEEDSEEEDDEEGAGVPLPGEALEDMPAHLRNGSPESSFGLKPNDFRPSQSTE